MFNYTVRALEIDVIRLRHEQQRIIKDSGYTEENISQAEEETLEALQLAEERVAEVELAQLQLDNFSKMMHGNPYTNY